jgi:hypothetical protein
MGDKKAVWYCVDDSAPENGYELAVNDRPLHDWGYIAQECAEDYYHNHDGWESSWPQDVFLRETEYGPIVASFSVHMEAEPQFYAYDKVPQ